MPYVHDPDQYALRFGDGPLAGLTAVLTRGGLDARHRGVRMVRAIGHHAETMALAKAVDVLARHLVRWDMVDGGGRPLPATRATLGGLDPALLYTLLEAWADTWRDGVVDRLVEDVAPGADEGEAEEDPDVLARLAAASVATVALEAIG